jgi:hypothetical protein
LAVLISTALVEFPVMFIDGKSGVVEPLSLSSVTPSSSVAIRAEDEIGWYAAQDL